ncbi:MAG: amidohydrolase family protein [Planctomycetes bacterium]|nr:amidohydrolase family protein [Planctomycetota bacterium]
MKIRKLVKGLTAAIPIAAALAVGCSILIHQIGGDFEGPPEAMEQALSPEARAWVAGAFEGLPEGELADFHVHLVGLGRGGTGAWVNPAWLTWRHPVKRGRTAVYMSAAGVEDGEAADRDYLERLVSLLRPFPKPIKAYLLALDYYHHADGRRDEGRSSFHAPNDYVFQTAQEHRDLFIPAVSIHPYRRDALEELEKWARRGVRHVKWIPNAMGIDPSSRQCLPFYEEMKTFNMILLAHTGDETAVDAEEDQHLGNPLLLRQPLDLGVTVVAFHSGSLGEGIDLESPGKERRPNFELFLRLLEDPRYDGRLFAEISALTFFTRGSGPLKTLLDRADLHRRLVYGSDYPLPGVNAATWTSRLARDGFLSEAERRHLDAVYAYNPLLFDWLVKRAARHPETGRRFAAEVFRAPPELR